MGGRELVREYCCIDDNEIEIIKVAQRVILYHNYELTCELVDVYLLCGL